MPNHERANGKEGVEESEEGQEVRKQFSKSANNCTASSVVSRLCPILKGDLFADFNVLEALP